jgi:hypothetical protein
MEKRTAEITTSSGFSCVVDLNRIASMELIDALREYQGGNPVALSVMLDIVFDKETKARLYDHVRSEDGYTPIEKIGMEVIEIFNGTKQGKNS